MLKRLIRPVRTIALCLATLGGLGWLGLKIPPAPLPAFPQRSPALETTPLAAGLPAPVEGFYRELYGDRVPIIRSAVLSGRATLRLGGLTFPARFRFTHAAGQSYRHYIEATAFGLPLMRVNETCLDGHGRMELPVGVMEGLTIDHGANLALWAETAAWLPALLLTDSRVRWEPVDNATALLVVPFGAQEEHMVARFDPASGQLRLLEAMRHQGASPAKTLWISEARAYGTVGGQPVMTIGALTWQDDGKPWAAFTVEDLVYNIDGTDDLRARGV